MKVLITYNLKRKKFSKRISEDFYSEFDSYKTVNSIAEALRSKGHKVTLVEANGKLLRYLLEHRKEIDFVFNIAEGINGSLSREAQVPAILDFLKIPYTGSGVVTMAISLDKFYTKKICLSESIPTPKFQLFVTGKEKIAPFLRYPLIVKPNNEGSAKGIFRDSVVYNKDQLLKRVRKIIKRYKQSALVEEFIEGKEITVGILGNGSPMILPLLEIDFSSCRGSGEFFYSWKVKEFQGNVKKHLTPTFYCPARLEKKTEEKIKKFALRAYRSINCFDFCRIDFRLDKKNNPYLLEINPLPGLNPEESNFPLMAKIAGINYNDLINKILESAVKRLNGEIKKGGRLIE